MKILHLLTVILITHYCLSQDTIYTESKIEIVNGHLPSDDSKYNKYHSIEAYVGNGIEVFNETHKADDYGTYYIRFNDGENVSAKCFGDRNYRNCFKTFRDTIKEIEYDYSEGDTFAIRKLYFDEDILIKSECIKGCDYKIIYTYKGDTLTELKIKDDDTFLFSYSIFDKKNRLILYVWGSQKPIFEGFYYYDIFEWDDEKYTSIKKTSASNSAPYFIEKTYYDDIWIPLRKEVAYTNNEGLIDKYTIRYRRDFDTSLSINNLPCNWIGITETDSGEVIFNDNSKGNFKISIIEKDGKKSLLEYGEQENSEYWINNSIVNNNKFEFFVESKSTGKEGIFTFQWVDQSKGIGRWTSDISKISEQNGLFVFDNFKNHFPIID